MKEEYHYKKVNKNIKISILFLLTNPKRFFNQLQNDNNYKRHLLYLLIISIIFHILWFSKILFILNNKHVNEQEALIYIHFFNSFTFKFIYYFIIFLVFDIVIIFILTMIIAILLKGICFLFNKNLNFKNFWKITIYSLTPMTLTLLINLVFYVFGWKSIYLQYIPDLLVLSLLIIGILNTSK